MKNITQYKYILWDFDGVLMDSMPVRSKGFELVLKNYPHSKVARLLEYHNENGGLSRYVKFRYFYETILGKSIDEEELLELTNQFSQIMLDNLTNEDLLIKDSLCFIEKYHTIIPMHIVSGSDGVELRTLCDRLNLSKYFLSINGSPVPKIQLVHDLIHNYNYDKLDVILIGDSINDLDAAQQNEIDFSGYNNLQLKSDNYLYINSFADYVNL